MLSPQIYIAKFDKTLTFNVLDYTSHKVSRYGTGHGGGMLALRNGGRDSGVVYGVWGGGGVSFASSVYLRGGYCGDGADINIDVIIWLFVTYTYGDNKERTDQDEMFCTRRVIIRYGE